jgi:hypothetical protein
MMVAIASGFFQLYYPFVKRAQAIDETGVLGGHRRHLFEDPDQRLLVAQHDRVSTLMSSRMDATSSRIRRCWAARNSRVTVSGIAADSGEPAEIGGDLDHAV